MSNHNLDSFFSVTHARGLQKVIRLKSTAPDVLKRAIESATCNSINSWTLDIIHSFFVEVDDTWNEDCVQDFASASVSPVTGDLYDWLKDNYASRLFALAQEDAKAIMNHTSIEDDVKAVQYCAVSIIVSNMYKFFVEYQSTKDEQ